MATLPNRVSVHLKVRIPGVLVYVSPHRRTDNVDLKGVLSSPLKSALCQSRCETQMPQLFRNFSVDQLQDVSRQAVFQVRNLPALLDFKPAGRYLLQLLSLPMKDIPHRDWDLFLARLPVDGCHRTMGVVPYNRRSEPSLVGAKPSIRRRCGAVCGRTKCLFVAHWLGTVIANAVADEHAPLASSSSLTAAERRLRR
jgi:hypothetical protein